MPRSPLPSHRFLLLNNITNWLSGIFVVFLLIFIISTWAIRYSIDRDCNNYYKRDTGLFSYWIHIEIGSKDAACSQPFKQLK